MRKSDNNMFLLLLLFPFVCLDVKFVESFLFPFFNPLCCVEAFEDVPDVIHPREDRLFGDTYLYEEEMEVTWEKGGSGLVFYTDDVYWEKQKGNR